MTGEPGEEQHIPTSNVEHPHNVLHHPYGSLLQGYYMQPHHPSQTPQHAGAAHPTYTDIEHPSLHQSQSHLLHRPPMSHPPPSSFDVGFPPPHPLRKRSRSDEQQLQQQLEVPNLIAQPQDPYGQAPGPIQVGPSQGYPLQPYPPPPPELPQQHHHHLPPSARHPKRARTDMPEAGPPSPSPHGPPNVVGTEGMPPPAPRPRGPKLKFTPEDDQLLIDLKEKKNLAWKQIADFFPGRSSGTLQVRYCTKLKAKTTAWNDEMVSATF